MRKKTLTRAWAFFMAGVLAFTGAGNSAYALGEEDGPGRSASANQMTSEPEVVYNNSFSSSLRKQNFDDNWKFQLGGDGDNQAAVDFDDSSWESISIPHDYSISQTYSSAMEAESGFLPGGTGWYRKHFVLDPSTEGKTIRLDFDGVYMNATVYLNGQKLGTHPYGYSPFSFDITDKVVVGKENTLAVKVDHRTPSSRWYSGSGIYRSVFMTVTDPVHVKENGVTVTTPKLANEMGGNVTTKIETVITNEGEEAEDVSLTHTIYKKGEETAIGTVTLPAKSLAGKASLSFEGTIEARSPELWSIENPALYLLRTEVKLADKIVDTEETVFGYRTFSIDPKTGAYLNGQKIKLKGVCLHHDQGALGAAAYRRAMERQIELLKDMGCNSIRVTHNPAAHVFRELCDEKGMLVIDELFDGWMHAKNGNRNDYSAWFNRPIEGDNTILGKEEGMTWAEFDIKSTIGKAKNAPSVVMWSLGNEIQEGAGGSGYAAKAPDLIRWAQEADDSRNLTIGSNAVKNGGWEHVQIANLLTAAGGASGTNYSDGWSYDRLHSNHPDWKLYGSETASSVNSRGVYYHKGGGGRYDATRQLTSYDKSRVPWGALASQAWYDVITRDFVAGEYVWTGFDYIGEPTPWNKTDPGPSAGNFETNPKNSYFGIIDTAGFPKDSYYLYQSLWNDKVRTLHLLPTWNKEDLALSGGKAEVVVYSDASSVELFLNGRSLGKQSFVEKTTDAGYTYQTVEGKEGHQNLYMTWQVPFEEGRLEAVAYDKDGRPIENTLGRNVVQTAGPPAVLSAKADRTSLSADGKDLCYVEVDILDAKGNPVGNADNRISFSVKGEGVLVGVDNGSSPDHDPYQADNRRAFSGKVLAIVRSTKTSGSFTVTASGEGLTASSVTVNTQASESGSSAEKEIDSFFYSKNYYVKKNNRPVLADQVEVRYTDGSKAMKSVRWKEIPEDVLAKPGSFTVEGELEGGGKVFVTVNVIDDVAALLNYSALTPLGKPPVLPDRRPVVMPDGTILSTTFAVNWEKPENAVYNQEGLVTIPGSAEVLGQKLDVTATIRVEKATVSIGDSVSSQAAEVTTDGKIPSDSLAAINDGSTAYHPVSSGPNTSQWSNYEDSQNGDNTAEITFRYDTSFALGQVVMHFSRDNWSARYPDPGTTEIYVSPSGEEGSWVKVEAEETIGDELPGPGNTGVRPYTYSFPTPYEATFVKVCVTNKNVNLGNRKPCTAITEIELKKASQDFIANSSTGLESLTINGDELSASALKKEVYQTPALVAELDNVKGKGNAAVTVLPPYQDVVRLITESEDHNLRSVFEIHLNTSLSPSPQDSDRDIPPESLAGKVIAGSKLDPPTSNEGNPEYVIDEKTETHWHTNWRGVSQTPLEERWIGFNFDQPTSLDALRYLPRQTGGQNGRVTEYRVEYKASDDDDWQPVPVKQEDGSFADSGKWNKDDDGWQLAEFAPITAKQVRLVGLHTFVDSGNDRFMSAAELRARMPKQTIDLSDPKNGIQVEVVGLSPEGKIEAYPVDDDHPVKPEVKVKDKDGKALRWGIDYKLTYENNTRYSQPGDPAKLIVEGIINYTGQVEKTFIIEEPARKLTAIKLEKLPKTEYMAGETFDPTGLTLTLSDNYGNEESLAYVGNEEGFTFTPALNQALSEADHEVTIEYTNAYGSQKLTLPIKVNSPSSPSDPTPTPLPDRPSHPWTGPNQPDKLPGDLAGLRAHLPGVEIRRISGEDRIETAVKISQTYYDRADTVILAVSNNYPDALVASGLARVYQAPILLTQEDRVNDLVAKEMKRLNAKKTILLGGDRALSKEVEEGLASLKFDVQRIAGKDRYETSALVARAVVEKYGYKGRTVIATGENWPDALSASALAAKEGIPILLSRRDRVDPSIKEAIKDLSIHESYLVGGDQVLSSKVEKSLPKIIRRFAGSDRYETAVLIADYAFKDSSRAFLASGESFPDALVIGPVAGSQEGPILLTRKEVLPDSCLSYLKKVKILDVLGGKGRIDIR
ncbi:MAG: cell wall-binding repeat-containing protein [Firmicutes bacterium]|nr:cell wall-binding repeat-containing protein [Bacillota bacterium]